MSRVNFSSLLSVISLTVAMLVHSEVVDISAEVSHTGKGSEVIRGSMFSIFALKCLDKPAN